MLHLVTTQDHSYTVKKLVNGLGNDYKGLHLTTYEKLFNLRKIPVGHYIFADLDRLSHYEKEIVIVITDKLRSADSSYKILNDPRTVPDRYPLLKLLYNRGINDFNVYRIDDGTKPDKYPVFIRCEDDHKGIDSDLIHNVDEFHEALESLIQSGKVLKRRIAIEYCAQKMEDGFYYKYGAININGTIIPQHVFKSENWFLKSRVRSIDLEQSKLENEIIETVPREEEIRNIFEISNIDYGRMDYTIVDNKIQVFEINTNPNFGIGSQKKKKAKFEFELQSLRQRRSNLIKSAMITAFKSVDTLHDPGAPILFELPLPSYHRVRQWRPELSGKVFGLYSSLHSRYPSLAKRIPGRSLVRNIIRTFAS